MKRIAIFGGNGFIGRHLVKELCERKYIVHVFDVVKIKSNTKSQFTNVSEISDEELIGALTTFNIVIDLVFATNPKTSFEDPIADIKKNLPNAVNLLNIAKELNNLDNYIFISSGGTIYGNSNNNLISENHPTNPISPYGITKLTIEKYAQMYYKLNGLPISIIRPSNAYGAGQKQNTGQGFITAAISAILNNSPITVYGNQGTIRDYIYVTDLCSAIADVCSTKGKGNVYNVGTGIGMSNLDVINNLKPLAKKHGKAIKIVFLEDRKFDVKINVLNSHKLKEDTGWSPKINIKEGLKLTWNDLKETN